MVEVNFHSDLVQIIRETRYLDRMGFSIPEIALNIALQECKYHQWLEGLHVMLHRFYEVGGWAKRAGEGAWEVCVCMDKQRHRWLEVGAGAA